LKNGLTKYLWLEPEKPQICIGKFLFLKYAQFD